MMQKKAGRNAPKQALQRVFFVVVSGILRAVERFFCNGTIREQYEIPNSVGQTTVSQPPILLA
jgi:hypothetical protein